VSERAAGDVGEDLLDDRVVAVLSLGLDQLPVKTCLVFDAVRIRLLER
jgi:hypothetical protein